MGAALLGSRLFAVFFTTFTTAMGDDLKDGTPRRLVAVL